MTSKTLELTMATGGLWEVEREETHVVMTLIGFVRDIFESDYLWNDVKDAQGKSSVRMTIEQYEATHSAYTRTVVRMDDGSIQLESSLGD